MTPPINIDGSKVTGITIDGTDVSEVTVDGQTVFAPNAIPDTSMFSDVAAQYWAAETSASDGGSGEFPEVLTAVPDATATNGPIFRSSQSEGANDYSAFEYNVSDGKHEIQTQSTPDLPEGNTTLSVFVLHWATDKNENKMIEYGQDGTEISVRSNEYLLNTFQVTNFSGGTPVTGEWATAGFVQKSSSFELYTNGNSSPANSVSETGSFTADGFIGAGLGGSPLFNGYIAEVIISSTDESGAAYQDWHNDRIS
jgi:hypothetical protein